jgi:hypothetical protein
VLNSRDMSAEDLALFRLSFEKRLGFSPVLVALDPDVISLETVKEVGPEALLADLLRRVEALEGRHHHAPPPVKVGH